MNYKNIGFIYEPHFKTKMFRVAKVCQMGKDFNYVVVTCSPMYNGLYKYDSSKRDNFKTWINGKLECYEIPISECTFVMNLDDIEKPDVKAEIIKQQKKWFNKQVKNRTYDYKNKPSWMLW